MIRYKGCFRGDIFVMLKCFVNIMGKCIGISYFYYKMMYILLKIYNYFLRRIVYNYGLVFLSLLCIWGILLCELFSVFLYSVCRYVIVFLEIVFWKWILEEVD